MSAPDTVNRIPTPSSLPPAVAKLLEQLPSTANVAALHAQLFDPVHSAEFWRTASTQDLTRVGAWAFMNKAHAFGVPAMMLAALAAAGGSVALFLQHFAGGVVFRCVGGVLVFVLGFLLHFNLLYYPLAPLWDKLFGCSKVSRIIRCLRPTPQENMLANCVMPGADDETQARVAAYLEDVRARRPFVVQDIRVAIEIAAGAEFKQD